MSSLIASIKDLITSVFEVIFSLFNKAFDIAYGLVETVINFFVGILRTALHTAGSALETVGGIGKFIASESPTLSFLSARNSANLPDRQFHRDCTSRGRILWL